MRRIITFGIGLFLWLPGNLIAQRVIYSESFNTRSSTRYRVVGKSDNFYWLEKQEKPKSNGRRGLSDVPVRQSFSLLDAKLNLLKEVPVNNIPGAFKQWLLAGETGLDQIVLTRYTGITKILRNHFSFDEKTDSLQQTVDSLPFSAGHSRFILVRSEDQSKILLIAFENSADESNRLHVILFNADWTPVYHQVISKDLFSQPCIQDDEIGFVAESFDNLPIKLANNGEWLMASPSRVSRNYSLFHACPNGSDFNFRDIPLAPSYKMEDIAMSIDNNRQEMSIGFLSAYQRSHLKSVQVCNYSMKKGQFDFDSSYHFTTQARDPRNDYLSHESFIAVPGGGYMLLKEYGSPFEFKNKPAPLVNPWETAYLLANYSDVKTNKEQLNPGYTTNRGLSPIPFVRNRGDLNIFYFPAVSNDSTWSGTLDMEQRAESNNPDLSYLIIPKENKLYIIYNSPDGRFDQLPTTTTLNLHGQNMEDGLVFWELKKMLNFQQSRRYSADEVAVPFLNRSSGFAIIRL